MLKMNPWRNFRKRTQSERIRAIPKCVSKPFEIIPNQSDKRFLSHLMKIGQKSIRVYPIHSALIRGMNLNESETSFQFE